MTLVTNLEDELVLHRDFERVMGDAADRPRRKREARLEEARELDGKLRALVRISQQAEAELARALRETADRGLYRCLGYPRIQAYAEAVLGIPGEKAKALVELARKLGRPPRLRAAFEAGEAGPAARPRGSRIHHLDPARNDPDALILVCWACHHKLIHGEYVFVRGSGATSAGKGRSAAGLFDGRWGRRHVSLREGRGGACSRSDEFFGGVAAAGATRVACRRRGQRGGYAPRRRPVCVGGVRAGGTRPGAPAMGRESRKAAAGRGASRDQRGGAEKRSRNASAFSAAAPAAVLSKMTHASRVPAARRARTRSARRSRNSGGYAE